jgi:hypothetical protein
VTADFQEPPARARRDRQDLAGFDVTRTSAGPGLLIEAELPGP